MDRKLFPSRGHEPAGARVHGLSNAEYQTVRAILDLPFGSERDRIDAAGVPSSTYGAARRRVFQEGWLRDVLLPSPTVVGVDAVEVRFARPSMSERDPLLRGWRSDPSCAVLWAGVHGVLGIFWPRGGDPAPAPPSPSTFTVRGRPADGGVPVYFDYSGLWSRFGGRERPAKYPRGLPAEGTGGTARSRIAAAELIESSGPPDAGPSPWAALVRSSRSHRDAIEHGLVHPRTVLDPARVPVWDGRRLAEVVFLFGVLRPGRSAADLLARLTTESGVFPFLYITGGDRVLLVAVGQTKADRAGRVPARAARGPVTSVLTDHLEPLEMAVEPSEALVALVQHRYPNPS